MKTSHSICLILFVVVEQGERNISVRKKSTERESACGWMCVCLWMCVCVCGCWYVLEAIKTQIDWFSHEK